MQHIPVLNYNYYFEILLRAIIFIAHHFTNDAPPFIREIHPNEIWRYQYPHSKSYVSYSNLWWIVIASPTIILIVDYLIYRNIKNLIRGSLAFTLSCGLTAFLSSLLKITVGRPRPDFYARCFPTGGGTDFGKCTGDIQSVNHGRKSFPSTHSSLAFCCGVFLTLYFMRRFKFLSKTQEGRESWQLCVLIIPLIVAAGISISRTCDYRHHYEDIIFGSLIGITLSYIIFKMYFNDIIDYNCNCKKKKTRNNSDK